MGERRGGDFLLGRWAVTLRTPIGSIEADYSFALGGDGGLVGSAAAKNETVELRDLRTIHVDGGERVTWSQTITKPLRLNLDFDVIVSGDTLAGSSRAGRLPRSTVTGRRVPGPDETD